MLYSSITKESIGDRYDQGTTRRLVIGKKRPSPVQEWRIILLE